jgi:hypothetical protein
MPDSDFTMSPQERLKMLRAKAVETRRLSGRQALAITMGKKWPPRMLQ